MAAALRGWPPCPPAPTARPPRTQSAAGRGWPAGRGLAVRPVAGAWPPRERTPRTAARLRGGAAGLAAEVQRLLVRWLLVVFKAQWLVARHRPPLPPHTAMGPASHPQSPGPLSAPARRHPAPAAARHAPPAPWLQTQQTRCRPAARAAAPRESCPPAALRPTNAVTASGGHSTVDVGWRRRAAAVVQP